MLERDREHRLEDGYTRPGLVIADRLGGQDLSHQRD